jgi:hypothetical protein
MIGKILIVNTTGLQIEEQPDEVLVILHKTGFKYLPGDRKPRLLTIH